MIYSRVALFMAAIMSHKWRVFDRRNLHRQPFFISSDIYNALFCNDTRAIMPISTRQVMARHFFLILAT